MANNQNAIAKVPPEKVHWGLFCIKSITILRNGFFTNKKGNLPTYFPRFFFPFFWSEEV